MGLKWRLLPICYKYQNLQEYHQSTSFDPDQTQNFVRPDLGPNCLHRLSADNTISAELISEKYYYTIGLHTGARCKSDNGLIG